MEVETSASAPAELHECSPRPLSQSPTQPEHGPRPVPFSPTQPEHGSQFPALSGTRGRVRASSQLSADLAEPIVLGWGGTEDMAGGGWGAEAERLRRPVWGNSTSGGKASLAGPRSGPGQGGSSMKSLLEEFVCPITQVGYLEPRQHAHWWVRGGAMPCMQDSVIVARQGMKCSFKLWVLADYVLNLYCLAFKVALVPRTMA